MRDVRRQLAVSRNVPAYVVASNKTLEAMAVSCPTDEAALLRVHGMGPTRAHLYGQIFLATIREHTD